MEKRWYLCPYRVFSGRENMAIDLVLSKNFSALLDRPLIRFYGWRPETISLGFSQNPHDIDMEKAIDEGIKVVRRPTGGRAIFHSRELTYSIIYPKKEMPREELYQRVNLWFQQLLSSYKIPSALQLEEPDFRGDYRKKNSSACFSRAARYELKVDKKKILGSAQRVFFDAILQHGSFMIGPEHLNLANYLKFNAKEKAACLTSLESASTQLESCLSEKVEARTVAGDLCRILELEGIQLVDFKDFEKAMSEAKKYYPEIELSKLEKI